MIGNFSAVQLAVVASGYLVLLLTSGLVVRGVLSMISKQPIEQSVDKSARDTGFIVGKCENFLVLTFMVLGAYTALALIFAAKAIVRKDDMGKNSLFFLAGTMVNVAYSVAVGLIVKAVVKIL